MNNDDISHVSTIPASFAIKSNVYSITHQCLIINNSQSQRALSVSVRTVLCLSEMAQVLKSLVKNLCSYFFTVRIDHNYPNKMIDFTVTGLWDFI